MKNWRQVFSQATIATVAALVPVTSSADLTPKEEPKSVTYHSYLVRSVREGMERMAAHNYSVRSRNSTESHLLGATAEQVYNATSETLRSYIKTHRMEPIDCARAHVAREIASEILLKPAHDSQRGTTTSRHVLLEQGIIATAMHESAGCRLEP